MVLRNSRYSRAYEKQESVMPASLAMQVPAFICISQEYLLCLNGLWLLNQSLMFLILTAHQS